MKRLTDEQRPIVEIICRCCRKADEAETGRQRPCAWKAFDNEYCPRILDALQEMEGPYFLYGCEVEESASIPSIEYVEALSDSGAHFRQKTKEAEKNG